MGHRVSNIAKHILDDFIIGSDSDASHTTPPGQEPGKHERDQARQAAQLRSDAFEKSKACYQKGDHAGAKKFSEEGKRQDALVDEWNEKAARVIFDTLNKDRSLDEMDLHGLFVKEAVQKVEERIQKCQKKGLKQFKCIVGKGIHSANGEAKIKPAIEDLVQKYNLRCSVDGNNTGCLVIELVDAKRRGIFGLFDRVEKECILM